MGIDKYVYAAGDATYTAFISRVEKQSKGYNGVSLSNYDATGVCVITDGSAFDIAGSMYLCTTDTSITGSVATGICYIYATGATSTASVAWDTTNAPVWRDDFQGYYQSAASAIRAIGGCYFDGSSYELKWVYRGYHSGPKTRYFPVTFAQIDNSSATIASKGVSLTFDNTDDDYTSPAYFPSEAVVTAINVYTTCAGDDAVAVYLYRCAVDDATTASQLCTVTANSGDADPSSSTIATPIIDNENYYYTVYFDCTGATGLVVVEGAKITYSEIVRN